MWGFLFWQKSSNGKGSTLKILPSAEERKGGIQNDIPVKGNIYLSNTCKHILQCSTLQDTEIIHS